MLKRKITVAFPEVATHDEKPTWRNGGVFADWTLHVSPEHEYRVHRISLGKGPRASAFLARAFESDGFASTRTGRTDLKGLVPAPCVGEAFEVALDFMYQGTLPEKLSVRDVVLLSKMGDVLQIPALQRACVDELNKGGGSSKESALEVLHALWDVGGVGEPLHHELQDAAAGAIAANFQSYSVEETDAWPVSTWEAVLKQKDLEVVCEDDVFKQVRRIVRQISRADQRARLWQQVRLGMLSTEMLAEAMHVADIPREAFMYIALGYKWSRIDQMFPSGILAVEWHGNAHFEPRKYRTMKCAYLYCVPYLEDAKYLRENFDGGKAIFDRLSDACSDVEMISMCRGMSRGVLDKFDVIVVGDEFDRVEVHESARRELSRFLGSENGRAVVVTHLTWRKDIGYIHMLLGDRSPFLDFPNPQLTQKEGVVKQKVKYGVTSYVNGRVITCLIDSRMFKCRWPEAVLEHLVQITRNLAFNVPSP